MQMATRRVILVLLLFFCSFSLFFSAPPSIRRHCQRSFTSQWPSSRMFLLWCGVLRARLSRNSFFCDEGKKKNTFLLSLSLWMLRPAGNVAALCKSDRCFNNNRSHGRRPRGMDFFGRSLLIFHTQLCRPLVRSPSFHICCFSSFGRGWNRTPFRFFPRYFLRFDSAREVVVGDALRLPTSFSI